MDVFWIIPYRLLPVLLLFHLLMVDPWVALFSEKLGQIGLKALNRILAGQHQLQTRGLEDLLNIFLLLLLECPGSFFPES